MRGLGEGTTWKMIGQMFYADQIGCFIYSDHEMLQFCQLPAGLQKAVLG